MSKSARLPALPKITWKTGEIKDLKDKVHQDLPQAIKGPLRSMVRDSRHRNTAEEFKDCHSSMARGSRHRSSMTRDRKGHSSMAKRRTLVTTRVLPV